MDRLPWPVVRPESWPVVRQLTGQERLGRGAAAAKSTRGDAPSAKQCLHEGASPMEGSVSERDAATVGPSSGVTSTPPGPPGSRKGHLTPGAERELFLELRRLPSADPRGSALRAAIARDYEDFVSALARRYRHRGEPLEDLVQTAGLGLVKAINGFDPERGTTFVAYAAPMILGELKRHFRDSGWAVRVTRRSQKLKLRVHRGLEELGRHGEEPSVRELARHLELSEEEVVEGLQAERVYSTVSLEALAEAGSGNVELAVTAQDDHRFESVIDHETVWPLLDRLPARERTILLLRFFGNESQSQIAGRLGISQVHVSRLQNRACEKLRDQMAS